jgi:hypothetical protein
MIDITIDASQLSYISSVIGDISTNYQRIEIDFVDERSMHLPTDQGVWLINLEQFTFNGNEFNDAVDAIEYLNSL